MTRCNMICKAYAACIEGQYLGDQSQDPQAQTALNGLYWFCGPPAGGSGYPMGCLSMAGYVSGAHWFCFRVIALHLSRAAQLHLTPLCPAVHFVPGGPVLRP